MCKCVSDEVGVVCVRVQGDAGCVCVCVCACSSVQGCACKGLCVGACVCVCVCVFRLFRRECRDPEKYHPLTLVQRRKTPAKLAKIWGFLGGVATWNILKSGVTPPWLPGTPANFASETWVVETAAIVTLKSLGH